MARNGIELAQANHVTRYRPEQRAGHYESFFLRANHPTRPLTFWIRYTIFSPRGLPGDARGDTNLLAAFHPISAP